MYKEVGIRKGGLFSKGLLKVPDIEEPSRDNKLRIRKNIEEEVFDIEDSVADNAKMISLLLSMVMRIYEVLPEDSLNSLSPQDKAIIEGTLGKFKVTETSADLKVKSEGMPFIYNILDRQAAVSKIIKEV